MSGFHSPVSLFLLQEHFPPKPYCHPTYIYPLFRYFVLQKYSLWNHSPSVVSSLRLPFNLCFSFPKVFVAIPFSSQTFICFQFSKILYYRKFSLASIYPALRFDSISQKILCASPFPISTMFLASRFSFTFSKGKYSLRNRVQPNIRPYST